MWCKVTKRPNGINLLMTLLAKVFISSKTVKKLFPRLTIYIFIFLLSYIFSESGINSPFKTILVRLKKLLSVFSLIFLSVEIIHEKLYMNYRICWCHILHTPYIASTQEKEFPSAAHFILSVAQCISSQSQKKAHIL